MSAAESAPAVSRPEGGWRDGDAVALVTSVSKRLVAWQRGGGQWRRLDVFGCSPASDDDVADWFAHGLVVYVHAPREPEPFMEPLPTEPCAIRATVRGVEGVVLVGPDGMDDWRSALPIQGWRAHDPEDITAWEPLLSRSEWDAEQDGDTVRVPRGEQQLAVARYLANERGESEPNGTDSRTSREILDLIDAERGGRS